MYKLFIFVVISSFSLIFINDNVEASTIENKLHIKKSKVNTAELADLMTGLCAVIKWRPDIVICSPNSDNETPTRTLTLKNGNQIVEKVIIRNKHMVAYYTEISYLPVTNYISQLTLTEGDDDFIMSWRSVFDIVADHNTDAVMTELNRHHKLGLIRLKEMVSSQ